MTTTDRRTLRERYKGAWVLIGLLALSGVSMAFVMIFGFFDSIAYEIVWRVFLANLYLIASLAAQHRWLRLTAWVGIGVTFLLGLVNAFWQYTRYYEWADGRREYTVGDENTGWSPWFGFEQDLELAAHQMLACVLVLGFVSLAYRWIAGERVLRGIYVFTFATALTATLISASFTLDSPFRWGVESDAMGKIAAGLAILALTGAAIVTVAAFVLRTPVRERAAADHGKAQAAAATDLAVASESASTRSCVASGAAHRTDDELRVLVREYVDEYLSERER